ncbi:MAG: ABC transporter permease [Aggregatilineales bacterium]
MASTSQTSQPSVVALGPEPEISRRSESLTQRALRRLRRDRLTMIAISVILLLTFLAIMAPVISTQILGVDFAKANPVNAFLPINSPGHILGTDDLGRDHLARLLYGGQVSLGIAFTAALLSIGIGVAMGIVTGFYGGVVDDLVIWLITTINSIPSLFLLLIISAVLSPGPFGLIMVLGLLGWTGTTRLVRGETLSLREREFVVSARALGASDWRIMFVHILPNLISIITIALAIDIGVLILVESGLSFLGFGIQPPIPSWGNMLTGAQTFMRRAPHLVFAPGLLILITVLCMYIIGDGIRDAFDPRMES